MPNVSQEHRRLGDSRSSVTVRPNARDVSFPSRADQRIRTFEVLLASVIAFCALLHVNGMSIIPLAALVAIPFLPIMGGAAPVGRLGLWLVVLLTSGTYLALSIPQRLGTAGPVTVVTQTLLWPVGGLITAIALAWSVRVLGLQRTLLYVGFGAIVSTLIDQSISDNWWKFGGSTGVTILVLAFAEKIGRRAAVFALAALAVANIVFDFRSLAVICFLVFGLALLINPIARVAARGKFATAAAGAILASAVSAAFSLLISSGLAGQALLERAQYQTSLGQNAILGGRTEWGATMDLMKANLWGFGAGTAPANDIVESAIEAAGRLGGDTASPYFYTEVFGARVDLHSSLGDLWYHFGIIGLFSALAISWLLFGSAHRLIRYRPKFWMTLLVLFSLALWDLCFSPMLDSAKIAVAFGLSFGVARMFPKRRIELSRYGPAADRQRARVATTVGRSSPILPVTVRDTGDATVQSASGTSPGKGLAGDVGMHRGFAYGGANDDRGE